MIRFLTPHTRRGLFAFLSTVVLLIGARMPCVHADPIIVTPSGQSSLPGTAQGETLQAVRGKPRSLSSLTIGLPLFEIEATNLTRPGREKLAFSAQTQVIPETSLTPAVSIGVRDLANTTRAYYDDGYYGRAYFIAADKILDKTVGAPTVLHDFSLSFGFGVGAMRGPFGSVSAKLPLRLTGTVEYDSRRINSRVFLPLGPVARIEYDRLGSRDFIGLQLHTPVAF